MDNNLSAILINLITCFLFGCLGGLLSFLLACKHGHYKNNKYISKFSIEIIGGGLTAIVVYFLPISTQNRILVSILVGLAWSTLLQSFRSRITRIISAILGDTLSS
jgi:hypothetical protein